MIHVMNLPLSFAENHLFKKVMFHAQMNGPEYVPPKRHAVGGILLDANYATTAEKNNALLLHEADTYGLGILDNGATIKKSLYSMC